MNRIGSCREIRPIINYILHMQPHNVSAIKGNQSKSDFLLNCCHLFFHFCRLHNRSSSSSFFSLLIFFFSKMFNSKKFIYNKFHFISFTFKPKNIEPQLIIIIYISIHNILQFLDAFLIYFFFFFVLSFNYYFYLIF